MSYAPSNLERWRRVNNQRIAVASRGAGLTGWYLERKSYSTGGSLAGAAGLRLY